MDVENLLIMEEWRECTVQCFGFELNEWVGVDGARRAAA